MTRKPDAKWAIPSEDEWYKAAYHKNDGVTGNYWDYPTGSDTLPSNVLGNPTIRATTRTFARAASRSASRTTERRSAAHELRSPYGTFDQGGNVGEWNEAHFGSYRGVRGGSFDSYFWRQ